MSVKLDPATIAAITAEARQCFLAEDGPKYLTILEEGFKQRHHSPDFSSLLRAAHSIKGGSGLVELNSLTELAHKLEDILEALEKQKLPDKEKAWMLVERIVGEIAVILSTAWTTEEVVADPELLAALDNFISQQKKEEELVVIEENTPKNQDDYPNKSLLEKALKQDLEASFGEIEELPEDVPTLLIKQSVEHLCEECLFLAETLELSWLVEGVEKLKIIAESSPEEILAKTIEAIAQLRDRRDKHLQSISSEPLPQKLTELENNEPPSQKAPENEKKQRSPQTALLSHVRIPLMRLENMSNNIEELILTQDRLRLQQQQFKLANQRLSQLVRDFEPIREEVESFYSQLAIAPESNFLTGEVPANPDDRDSESPELDSYTEFHSSLQTFQELMLQVQETRKDLDLINRELAEDIQLVHKNLDLLYNDVTESRLVPFKVLAKRFVPQIQSLNRRYNKSVQLEIEGQEILIDQVLLEALQTPLTHLLNNAFDHGIETREQRLVSGKSQTALITLKASVQNDRLEIYLQDDGRGIDLQKVYNRAIERGICPAVSSFDQFKPEHIINWIFQPDFSTSTKVSDLSGRGMGLDIVRSQIQRLRGTISVSTKQGRGTTFTVKLPLNLSLVSLLFVQLQDRTIAIPCRNIRDSLLYSELNWLDRENPTINWQGQAVPVFPLSQMLFYTRSPVGKGKPQVGIILEASFGLLMVTVNGILSEGQFIVKPFDDTIKTPPYLAGCTILGTGEVVPVILPQAFGLPSFKSQVLQEQTSTKESNNIPTIMVVDDSVAMRRMLKNLVSATGYQVVVARDGQEAIDILHQKRKQIDLVISDVEMPRLNGFELLNKIRTNSSWRDIPVAIVTSRAGDRHRMQGMQLGANAYLGKPVQPQELLATLSLLLSPQSS